MSLLVILRQFYGAARILRGPPRRVACLAAAVCAGGLVYTSHAGAEDGRHREIVEVGAAQVDVLSEGQGTPIVLLPSTGRGSDDLDELAADLSRLGFRVLRPQPRGIGASVGAMDDVTFHDFASDVAGVIRHFGSGPAIVAGHAYGNWIARTVASDHPDLVAGVVLIASGAERFPTSLSREIDVINDSIRPVAERLRALRVAFFAPGHDPTSWLSGWHPAVTRSQRAAGARTDRRSWWAAGHAPILDLVGADDPFRPAETVSELRDAMGSRVTLVVVPDTSHALPAEEPSEVARAIDKWSRSEKLRSHP